jgi:hypothetical protein
MPYQPNSPRWEFITADRTSLNTIASQANAMMRGVSPSTGHAPVLRSDFDGWKNAILALAPTFNSTGPFPDTR